ncbi:FAD-binding domain-containing protein [Annulohypoxylon moriforme]|nr:FAD-binding domain-containing protein [Annulohypoxylon moriforme]
MIRPNFLAAFVIIILRQFISACNLLANSLTKKLEIVGAELTTDQVAPKLSSKIPDNFKMFGIQPQEGDVSKIIQLTHVQRVEFANDNGIPFLAVDRKHGTTTSQERFDGLQIDMNLLNDTTINPSRITAWSQGGVYASCDGRGHPEGFYGLISDSFVTLNVALASGTSVVVSEESNRSNSNLLWDMKGAGHNPGIVTSLEAKIHYRPTDSDAEEMDTQVLLIPLDSIEAVITEDGNVPYPEVAEASWLCDYGLQHMHYYRPVFKRSAVVMEDYSHEGVVIIDPATSSYPWRDRSLLSFITMNYSPDPTIDDFARCWARLTRDLSNRGLLSLLLSIYLQSMHEYDP